MLNFQAPQQTLHTNDDESPVYDEMFAEEIQWFPNLRTTKPECGEVRVAVPVLYSEPTSSFYSWCGRVVGQGSHDSV